MKKLQKKEFKYLILVYMIISKISIILQIFQYIQLYNQQDGFVYLSDKAFAFIFCSNRYACALYMQIFFKMKKIKVICLITFFLEDIYFFSSLKYELEEQKNEEIMTQQNLLNDINEEDFKKNIPNYLNCCYQIIIFQFLLKLSVSFGLLTAKHLKQILQAYVLSFHFLQTIRLFGCMCYSTSIYFLIQIQQVFHKYLFKKLLQLHLISLPAQQHLFKI
ncbi:transmembrane protein, putative (macronuclear) [Tetrahymena thermophila SB210]|uniref:Transmembrane protein, putative n=1 Tax=Tetrahymena thermophila (strain SB210) TaxID=312017 RepID=W7XCM8_TETTS|nr:transmembrane protein, putative [Tetrahymena thermophila SB210]EWS75227.1 transmembrane protein, putative [Tetrahymena thermophila SB210]|eukprot:XP_012652218.1 transmembrane protein, putative [Tetrahymena thermophila SB210]